MGNRATISDGIGDIGGMYGEGIRLTFKHLHVLGMPEQHGGLHEVLEVGVDTPANAGVDGCPFTSLNVDVIANL